MGNFINVIKNLILGAHSGAALLTVGFARGFVLSRTDKTSRRVMWGIFMAQVTLWFLFREDGWLAILPLISSLSYTYINFTTQDILISKQALMVSLVLWAIYYITVGDWVSISVNVFSMVSLALSIMDLEKDTRCS